MVNKSTEYQALTVQFFQILHLLALSDKRDLVLLWTVTGVNIVTLVTNDNKNTEHFRYKKWKQKEQIKSSVRKTF